MPEIKHSFSQGKMNKDLDERLVPNGQYRDAMNIQVATSEGSSVGTVQNILGNKLVEGQELLDRRPTKCLASTSTEVDNALYWLINEPISLDLIPFGTPEIPDHQLYWRNMILEYKNNIVKPIFVDIYEVRIPDEARRPYISRLPQSINNQVTQPASFGQILVFIDTWIGNDIKVRPKMKVEVVKDSGVETLGIVTRVSKTGNKYHIQLEHPSDVAILGSEWFRFTVEEDEKVLGFESIENNQITGINTVDGMIFWTDNYTEPKKINIDRSIKGTDPSGNIHTKLVNENDIVIGSRNEEISIKQEHITVIKNYPTNPPTLDFIDSEGKGDGVWSYATIPIIDLEPGDEVELTKDTNNLTCIDFTSFNSNDNNNIFSYDIGDTLSLNVTDGVPNDNDFDVQSRVAIYAKVIAIEKGGDTIGNDAANPTNATFKIRITEINFNNLPSYALPDVGLSPHGYPGGAIGPYFAMYPRVQEKSLFELKFPRFSYRYKYADGEYSAFAPWSKIAFKPSSFNYLPNEGYNLGMVNSIKSLAIKDFVPSNLPLDVVKIDLLYKESDLPNVYVIDTISPKDAPTSGSNINFWNTPGTGANKGYYKITSETIYASVPENQTLRPWDNVPRKALSQDIIGNRLIYGNYVHKYDLSSAAGETYRADIDLLIKSNDPSHFLNRSIKTLREYQVGIVFTDKYGRETPVLTDKSAVVRNNKENAVYSNVLEVTPKGNPPEFASGYVFYVKDTSEKYHNLVMDRYYDAEDGNIWVSFPSSDRNKIDEDTYLHLKQSQDGSFVSQEKKYKVLAIENEAPEFVKTTYKSRGAQPFRHHTWNGYYLNGAGHANCAHCMSLSPGTWMHGSSFKTPHTGKNTVKLRSETVEPGTWKTLLLDNIQEKSTVVGRYLRYPQGMYIIDGGSLDFTPLADPEKVSKWYGISTFAATEDGFYDIIFDEKLGPDCEWLNKTYEWAPSYDAGYLKTRGWFELALKVVERKPEFDGRFFVKVKKDNVIEEKIMIAPTTVDSYSTVFSQQLYYFKLDLLNNGQSIPSNTGNDSGTLDFYKSSTLNDDNNIAYTDRTFPHMYSMHQHAAGFQMPNGGWNDVSQNDSNMPFKTSNSHHAGRWRSTGQWSYGWSAHQSYLRDIAYAWGRQLGNPHVTLFSMTANPDEDNVKTVPGSVSGPKWFIDELKYCGSQWGHRNYPNGRTVTIPDELGGGSGHIPPYAYSDGIQYSATETGFGGGLASTLYDPLADPYNVGQVDWSTLPDWNATRGWNKGHGVGKGVSGDTIDISLSCPGIWDSTADDYPDDIAWMWDLGLFDPSKCFWDNPNVRNQTPVFTEWVFNADKFNNENFGGGDNCAGMDPTWARADRYAEQVNREGNNPNDGNPQQVMKYLQVGKKFRFHNDITDVAYEEQVYEIVKVERFHRYNYLNDDIWIKNNPNRNWKGYDYSNQSTIGMAASGPRINPFGTQYISRNMMFSNKDPRFEYSSNRRITYRLTTNPPIGNNGAWYNPVTASTKPDYETAISIHFVENVTTLIPPTESFKSETPGIWETEPKDNTDLDIYYKASRRYPTNITPENVEQIIPIGSRVLCASNNDTLDSSVNTGSNQAYSSWLTVANFQSFPRIKGISGGVLILDDINITGNMKLTNGNLLKIIYPDGVNYIFVEIDGSQGVGGGVGTNIIPMGVDVSIRIKIGDSLYNLPKSLDWSNCYSFGNGVESIAIRDDFNGKIVDKGVFVSTTSPLQYSEERLSSGIIYSGLYNAKTNINNLNQFIAAEKITKDLNPEFGSIQKLHARDTDLIALCEDKIVKILANKDAIFNAEGNPQLIATQNVLGQATTFEGEFGISKNPESFASESFRAYFTDKQRGAVLRLSKDGLTPISDHGMKDWFRDNMTDAVMMKGTYDEYKDEYNLSISSFGRNHTISFSESTSGWVSFKSFFPESGVSVGNEYYTFSAGKLYKHHDERVDRNTFYGIFANSSISVLLNDDPNSIKGYKTLNYDGTQSRIQQNTQDNEYYNLESKDGWYVGTIITDQQQGSLREFIEKEGKWFNNIHGREVWTNNTEEFNFQGIGKIDGFYTPLLTNIDGDIMEIPPVIGPPVIYGCTNPLATNYNPYATDDDGSCVFPGTGGPGTGGPGVGGPVTGGPVTGVRGPGQPSQPNVTSNAVVDASLTPSEQISELDESEPQQQRGYQEQQISQQLPLSLSSTPAPTTQPLAASWVINTNSIPTYNDGSIDLTVTGGTGNYTFAWSTGATTQNITGLGMGPVAVHISDGVSSLDINQDGNGNPYIFVGIPPTTGTLTI